MKSQVQLTGALKGKTVFITGASRGIGREIALLFARDGANIALAAKTEKEDSKLSGTIHSVAEEVESAGGKSLALKVDVRQDAEVLEAVRQTATRFGGIDIVINNAGAISLTPTLETPMKRFDLMHQVNTRAVFLCSQTALPYLVKSANPHIVNLSPPLSLDAKWYAPHLGYSLSKYGMSLCTLGMAEEFRAQGIAVNSLWPKTAIATAAIKMLMGDQWQKVSRYPSIIADAAYLLVTSPAKKVTGHHWIDEEILKEHGIRDFNAYACQPGAKLMTDLFVEP